jgi:HD-GYP domain-containing protein (c-di-GMP phosphodiesterase class II)
MEGLWPCEWVLLKGGEIPEVVRLVTVADTYDALISPTAIRPAFLPVEALEILKEEAGTKLDRTSHRS